MTQITEREALPPQVVEAARKALVISLPEALAVLHNFDASFIPLLSEAVAQAETDIKLRSALNRILFTSRNSTFAAQCKIELAKYKENLNAS
jgi:hypothetical protein